MNEQKPSFWRFLRGISVVSLQLYGLYLFLFGNTEGVMLAFAVTLGDTSAPADITTYLDSLFSQSLPHYRKSLTDNIGESNAVLFKIMQSGLYESYEGGLDIRENLMYELAPSDWYDGYDELPDAPTDGITQARFPAVQQATPITYSMKEVIQNRNGLTSLVESKIMQGEMGIQEGFAQAFMHGSKVDSPTSGSLATARTGVSGASAIEPLLSLIRFDPTTSTSVGNINQATHTWWQNNTKTSAATSHDGLLKEFLNAFNTASLGTGGPPDLVLVDQTTYELMAFALYAKYRNTEGQDDFPFTNIKLPFGSKKTLMIMDDKVPDAFSNKVSAATYGTAIFVNTKFLRLRYIPDRDFEMLKDENGKSFVKPIKGDSRLAHLVWMGATTINNRRKHNILGKIARTLT